MLGKQCCVGAKEQRWQQGGNDVYVQVVVHSGSGFIRDDLKQQNTNLMSGGTDSKFKMADSGLRRLNVA